MNYDTMTVEEIDRQLREALYFKDQDKVYYLIQARARKLVKINRYHKISDTYLLSLIEKNIKVCNELSKLLRKKKPYVKRTRSSKRSR